MRIAVVGGGVSGLVAAYRLASRHDVHLLEAEPRIGGHVHTVDVEWKGERHAVDTGFIVFNDGNYPRFVKLLEELGVASRPTTMGFSVRSDETDLEYCGSSLRGVFAQTRNLFRPSFLRMARDILRFNRDAVHNLESSSASLQDDGTVADFIVKGGYSKEFAEHYLLPMGSAIWSCPMSTFADFPIRFILEFYRNHGLLSLADRPIWRVIEGGSKTYVEALLKRFRGSVKTNAAIQRIVRKDDSVVVEVRNRAAEAFDHVVVACHADQALRLLDDPTPLERATLSAFPYQRNRAVLHTDVSVLPKRRRAWASWNYRVERNSTRAATVTYCMNILQHLKSKHVFNLTLNSDAIDPATVIREFEYRHPVFTTNRRAAQSRFPELANVNRTSFCGAYWGNGFHEDGVASAEEVVAAIERKLASAALTELAAG
jgi:predicted NAD/FAD-binding protein